jgi:hypothetical protein
MSSIFRRTVSAEGMGDFELGKLIDLVLAQLGKKIVQVDTCDHGDPTKTHFVLIDNDQEVVGMEET